jgi:hypothetical protein
LTKVAKTIITEDNGVLLRERIVELKIENSQLRATTAESAEKICTLQWDVDNGVEDYNLLMEGNESLLAEHSDFHYRYEDLKVELAEVHSDAEKRTTDLEARVKAIEAHSVNVAAAGEKWLKNFEGGLVWDLVELCALYVHHAQTIGGLCSPMPEGKPSVADYLCWLSTEISDLLDKFGGINENFVTAMVEGALVMDGILLTSMLNRA